jgi:DNA replication and repair protein RecF
MTARAIQHLSLTEFRSYERLDFAVAGRSVYLFGPNGAGKTNLLEAISVLNPGKGLRGAGFDELGRRLPDESQGRAWGVAATLGSGEDEVQLGTGTRPGNPSGRVIRLDGETVNANRMLEHLRLIWLTPAQDRIFIESRSERLRFFDRLVYAAEPAHAQVVAAYEKSQRERMRLLQDHPHEDAWIKLIEHSMAEQGEKMIAARRRAVAALQAEIDSHQGSFPRADLSLTGGDFERENDTLLNSIRAGLFYARERDTAAGRSLFGPHRMDLSVVHRDKNRPAADCSTGEQKALLLNIILAQGARLSAEENSVRPTLLLDEVAAHLDPLRRHALFDETHALGLQTFFPGTDQGLFDGLKTRALGVRVEAGQFVDFIE